MVLFKDGDFVFERILDGGAIVSWRFFFSTETFNLEFKFYPGRVRVKLKKNLELDVAAAILMVDGRLEDALAFQVYLYLDSMYMVCSLRYNDGHY